MKKIVALVLVLYIPTLVAASTTIKKRTHWWESRKSTLNAEIELLKEKPYYTLLAKSVESDIEQTKELIDFAGELGGDKAAQTKSYSTAELTNIATDTLPSLFATYYQEMVFSQSEKKEIQTHAATLLNAKIDATIENLLPAVSEQEKAGIKAGLISTQLKKSFAYELLTESALTSKLSSYKSYSTVLNQKLLEEFNSTETTDDAIIRYLIDESKSYFQKQEQGSLPLNPSLADNAPALHDIVYAAEKRCENLKAMRNFLSKHLATKEGQAAYYIQYPYRLESEIFSYKAGDLEQLHLAKQSLDTTRKQILQELSSKQNSNETDLLKMKLKNTALHVKAKYSLTGDLALGIDAYHTLCLEYIDLCSTIKFGNTTKIEKNIDHRFERYKAYNEFHNALFFKSNDVAGYRHSELEATYIKNITLYKKHNSYLKYGASILPQYKKYLSNESNAYYSKIYSDSSKLFKTSAASIAQSYSSYLASKQSNKRSQFHEDQNMLKQYGETELAVLAGTIELYHESYLSLNYSDKLLQEYSKHYRIALEQMGKGLVPEHIEQIYKENSFKAALSITDDTIFENERLAKLYLANAIKRDIVRYTKILQVYKQNKIELKAVPKLSKLYKIEASLRNQKSVRVYKWKMNEANFAEIDKRAVYVLKTLHKKKTWEKSSEQLSTAHNDQKHSLEAASIDFYIPEGWTSSEPKKESNELSFKNSYDNSILAVTLIEADSEGAAVSSWIESERFKPVQSGWDTYGDRPYFWKVAKDDSGQVAKIYAYAKNGKIILVSGITTKKRYPFFHNRIDTVFQSIED